MARKLLVVENDEGNRDALRETLEDEGYEVEAASNGAAALVKLDVDLPDRVVLDLMMPVLDGFGFAAEMSRRGLRPAVPILVVSGSPPAVHRLADFAPEGFIAKPWDITVLLSEVARLAGPPDGPR